MQASHTLPDSQTSTSHAESSEEEGEGQSGQGDETFTPAGPSEGASPVLTLSPSSSSPEHRGRSAGTPAQHSALGASPHAGVTNAAAGAKQQGQMQLSPRQTRNQRAQTPHGLSSHGQDVHHCFTLSLLTL